MQYFFGWVDERVECRSSSPRFIPKIRVFRSRPYFILIRVTLNFVQGVFTFYDVNIFYDSISILFFSITPPPPSIDYLF